MSAGADIGPGDWVECIDATDCVHLAVGNVYQVKRVLMSIPSWYRDNSVGAALDLVNVPREWEMHDGRISQCAYAIERFRPLSSPKSELIQSLLKSADAPVKEDA